MRLKFIPLEYHFSFNLSFNDSAEFLFDTQPHVNLLPWFFQSTSNTPRIPSLSADWKTYPLPKIVGHLTYFLLPAP